MQRYCSGCGTEFREGHSFCGNCGTRFNQEPQSRSLPTHSVMVPSAAPAVPAAAPLNATQSPPQQQKQPERPSVATKAAAAAAAARTQPQPQPKVGAPPPAKSKAGRVLATIGAVVSFVLWGLAPQALRQYTREARFASSDASYASPTTAALAPVALHTYRPGDTWHYTLAVTASDNGRTLSGTGTMDERIMQTQLNGQNVLADTDIMSLQMPGENQTTTLLRTYFYQDGNGNYDEVADDNGPNNSQRLLSTPIVVWPGQWTSSVNYSNTLNFTNGDKETAAFATQGSPSVQSLPDGIQATCWPMQETDVNAKGQQNVSNELWSPQLGQLLSGSISQTDNHGLTVQINFKLSTYQFAGSS